MERLRELLFAADRGLSEIEREVERAPTHPENDLPQQMEQVVGMVWACAERYLRVVDGLEANTPVEVVEVARHTGLLGDDEAEDALRVLDELRAARALGYSDPRVVSRHVRLLRLWLERVRDTAAKAEDVETTDPGV